MKRRYLIDENTTPALANQLQQFPVNYGINN